MVDNTNILEWLSNWFTAECNGDWEHENGISIITVDNPGWSITIDLENTNLEHLEIENDTIERSENDWYFFEIKNKKFRAAGDLTKLAFLLTKFKEIVEYQEALVR